MTYGDPMDRQTTLKLQQIEFFLLHSLVVDEFRLIRRSKRITPVRCAGESDRQRMALVGRLFRSFLGKVFLGASISKRPRSQAFNVGFGKDACDRLRRIQDADPDLCRTLQAEAGEIGFVRLNFPHSLIVTIAIGHPHRHGYRMGIDEMGIGRHCSAARAVLSWKARFDTVLSSPNGDEGMVGPPEPKRNQAQEQLEAVLRGISEAGRL
jgi:hypothetical protein